MKRTALGISNFVFYLFFVWTFFFASTCHGFNIQFPLEGKPEELIEQDYMPYVTVITQDEVRLYSAPEAMSTKKKIYDVFLKAIGVAAIENNYYLVATINEDFEIASYLGWLKQEDLLKEPYALKNPDTIFKKALIVNRWRDLKKMKNMDLKQAKAWNGLSVSRKLVKRLSLFEIYFIYMKRRGFDGKMYYLLGTNPLIQHPSAGKSIIIGWVLKERILDWDTRDALHFNKTNLAVRSKLGRLATIHFTSDNLTKWYIKGNRPKEGTGSPMAHEADAFKRQIPYDHPRYPILGKMPLSQNRGNIFKIGYIGDTITTAGDSLSAYDTFASKGALEDLKRSIKSIDIHFILDTTLTMGPAFKQLKRAIIDSIEEIRSPNFISEQLRVRFGLLMYRDFSERNKADSYLFKNIPLTEDPDQIVDILEKEQDDGGGDIPEANFFAITKSLKNSPPRLGSLSALFLITDAKNTPNDSKHTFDTVIELVREHRTAFFPVIYGDNREAIGEAKRLVKNISEDRGENDLGVNANVLYGEFESGSKKATDQITGSIREILNDYLTLTRLIKGGISDKLKMEGRQFSLGGETVNIRLSRELFALMMKSGVNPVIFAKEKAQIFETGYIAEKPEGNIKKYRLSPMAIKCLKEIDFPKGILKRLKSVLCGKRYKEMEFKRQIGSVLDKDEHLIYMTTLEKVCDEATLIQHYVLIEWDTLSELADIMQRMLNKRITKKNLTKIWGDSVCLNIGETKEVCLDKSGSFAELVKKHRGLPVNNDLLKYKLSDFETMKWSKVKKLMDELELKKQIIVDFKNEQKTVRKVVAGNIVTLEAESRRESHFFTFPGGKVKYAWVPIEILP